MPNLNTSIMSAVPFLLPTLDEQRAIAGVLGSLDDKIEQNRRTAGKLEELARAVFKAWFVDFAPVHAKANGATTYPGLPPEAFAALPNTFQDSPLGQIPEGWAPGSMGDIIEIHDSKRIPLSRKERDARKGKFRYYGAASIVGYVDDYLFDGRYVLIGEDGTVFGDGENPMVQYVWGKFWVNNHAHVLTGKSGFSVEHLVVLFQQVCIRPFITGAVQPKLNQKNLKAIPIVLATRPIIDAYQRFIDPLFAKQRQLADESRKLAELRDYLLPRLLSGAVRVSGVRDAETVVEGVG